MQRNNMEPNRLKEIISEEVERVLEQESARITLAEGGFDPYVIMNKSGIITNRATKLQAIGFARKKTGVYAIPDKPKVLKTAQKLIKTMSGAKLKDAMFDLRFEGKLTEVRVKKGDIIKMQDGEYGVVNKLKGKVAYIKLNSNPGSFHPIEADRITYKGKHKGKDLYSESIVTEAKDKKLAKLFQQSMKASIKDGEDKLYKLSQAWEDWNVDNDDKYDDLVDTLFSAIELVQDAGEPGKNNVVKDKEYYSYMKSAAKLLKQFNKDVAKAAKLHTEGKLDEGKKIKIGQQFNADGITWKVIKVGATQSRAEAITKSAKKKQGTYDNKTISKFAEGKLNEAEMEFGVEYRDSKGNPKKKGSPIIMRYKNKAKADKFAKKGNQIDKVGGKYTVVKVPMEEDTGKSSPYGSGYKKEKDLNEAEYITNKFKKGQKIKTNVGTWIITQTNYKPGKKFKSPFVFRGPNMKKLPVNLPSTNSKAVGYKVKDDGKYPITGFLYQHKDITILATIGVDESISEAMDMNDPILIAVRARKTMLDKAKSAPKVKKISMNQYYKLMDKEIDLINQMKGAAKEYEQLDSEMNQEAGQKGADWSDADANRYGGGLNKIQTKIEKLAKQKLAVKKSIMNYRMS